jgi:hypothetical protein
MISSGYNSSARSPPESVQTLFLSGKIAGHVSRALEDIAGVMATEVLPALDMLFSEDQPVSSVHKFVVFLVAPLPPSTPNRTFED